VVSELSPVAPPQPQRLARNPRYIGVKVGQQQAIALEQALIAQMGARGGRPKPTAIVAVASPRSHITNRPAGHNPPQVDTVERRHDGLTIGVDITRLHRMASAPHARDYAPE
jgi:hypothetical protein